MQRNCNAHPRRPQRVRREPVRFSPVPVPKGRPAAAQVPAEVQYCLNKSFVIVNMTDPVDDTMFDLLSSAIVTPIDIEPTLDFEDPLLAQAFANRGNPPGRYYWRSYIMAADTLSIEWGKSGHSDRFLPLQRVERSEIIFVTRGDYDPEWACDRLELIISHMVPPWTRIPNHRPPRDSLPEGRIRSMLIGDSLVTGDTVLAFMRGVLANSGFGLGVRVPVEELSEPVSLSESGEEEVEEEQEEIVQPQPPARPMARAHSVVANQCNVM